MSRIAVALAAAAGLIAAAPAAGQSAGARMTASATVVEPISFSAGRSTVAATRGGIDVTTPLAVTGRAAHVLHVVRGDGREMDRGARILPLTRPIDVEDARALGDAPATGYRVSVRILPPSSADARTGTAEAVTYVIATVN